MTTPAVSSRGDLPMIDLLKAYFQIDARDDGRTIREKAQAERSVGWGLA